METFVAHHILHKMGDVPLATAERVVAEHGDLLRSVFTHRNVDPTSNYETLEFFGDAYLNAAVTELLQRSHATVPAGILTRIRIALVSHRGLADMAAHLGLPTYIRVQDVKGVESVYEDVLEALMGYLVAVLPFGFAMSTIRTIVSRCVQERPIRVRDIFDPITQLKELQDKHGRGRGASSFPTVQLAMERQGDTFRCSAVVNGRVVRSAEAVRQQDAKREAAQAALDALRPLGFVHPDETSPLPLEFVLS